MKEIAIIDYGMCNLDSVARAVEKRGATPVVTDDPNEVESADGIILPGVGSFADAMAELRARKLVEVLRSHVLDKEKPFLGICLGMQLMAEKGHEGGETEGLGLVPGQVVRLVADRPDTRIPHVGWNEVEHSGESGLFAGIPSKSDFYFVHSFHFQCDDEYILARTNYCGGFVSAVHRGGCFGVQFHTEKSLKNGMQLLDNFLELC